MRNFFFYLFTNSLYCHLCGIFFSFVRTFLITPNFFFTPNYFSPPIFFNNKLFSRPIFFHPQLFFHPQFFFPFFLPQNFFHPNLFLPPILYGMRESTKNFSDNKFGIFVKAERMPLPLSKICKTYTAPY